ncbi:MAG: nucleotidyltransferase domain-containing protein [Planctomycetota bacterium]
MKKMNRPIPKGIQPILKEVKERLKEIYGERLKRIILHGSYARGDFTDGSDIDLIILLDDMEDSSAEHEKYFEAIWQLDLKYDTVVSVIAFKEEDYDTRRLAVILNAKREGVPV